MLLHDLAVLEGPIRKRKEVNKLGYDQLGATSATSPSSLAMVSDGFGKRGVEAQTTSSRSIPLT